MITMTSLPAAPVHASAEVANRCGQGYILRSSVPVNMRWVWDTAGNPKIVSPVATIKVYAHPQMGAKCALMSVRSGWSQKKRIKRLTLQVSWPTEPGTGGQTLLGKWFDAKNIDTTSQSSAGPITVKVRRCVDVVASIKISSKISYSGNRDMAAC